MSMLKSERKLVMSKGLEIPFEVADSITLANMLEQYQYLAEELRQHDEEGKWMHPEDTERSRLHIIPALKCLIEYYGGKV